MTKTKELPKVESAGTEAHQTSISSESQSKGQSHSDLENEIEETIADQLIYAYDLDPSATAQHTTRQTWELFFEESKNKSTPMALYRQKYTPVSDSESSAGQQQILCDPIRAVATVAGVTAHELCTFFFSPDHRTSWESHILSVDILEKLDPATLVLHQAYESPVWTVKEREALFWSALRKADQRQVKSIEGAAPKNDPLSSSLHDVWLVVNKSTSIDDVPPSSSGKRIRLEIIVSLIAETYIIDKASSMGKVNRKNLRTRFRYNAQSDPGGWIPLAVIRTIYKREFPKMMRRFTETAAAYYQDKEVTFGE